MFKKLIKSFALSALALSSLSPLASGLHVAAQEDPTVVKWYQIGGAPENLDVLLEQVNAILAEKVGAVIDMEYIGWGEYNDKMTVMINAGEKYDIAYAVNYLENAQKGAFADLTDLMNEYAADSLEMIDDAYIRGNTIDGKLYAFPVNGNVFAKQYWAFNPTFLEKYNFDPTSVQKMEDLEPLLQAVKEGDPEVAPLAAGSGWRVGHDFDLVLGGGVPLGVDILGDHTKIINPYEEGDSTIPDLYVMHDFYNKGYVPADAATSDQGYPLEADTWAVRRETVGPRDYGSYLLQAVSGKALQIQSYTEVPLKSVAQARMANFVVAQNSDNKEAAIKVLNEINSNPDVLNILVYGPEGENWTRNEDGTIKLLEPYAGATHMSAWNTGNSEILYKDEKITEEQLKEFEDGMAEAVESPLLGFNFVTDAVKTEIANVQTVTAQYESSLHTGTVNPEEVLPEFIQALKDAGLDKIQEEMQRQYDEFLANKE
ncbi:TPA: ABC transporter substrate-binding protein [Streptococcus suis]